MTDQEKIAALEVEKANLEKQVKDNNRYIGTLESENKKLKEAAPAASSTDPVIANYIENKMREEVLATVSTEIVAQMGDEIFKALEADFKAFLTKNMTRDKMTVAYAWDAFFLVLGRARKNPDHPIQAIVKGTPAPSPTTPPAPGAGTNQQSIEAAKRAILGNPPPSINNKDGGATPPPDVTQKPTNTKDAFGKLSEKLKAAGANRFQ